MLKAAVRAGIAIDPDEPTDVMVTLERNALAALDDLFEQLQTAEADRVHAEANYGRECSEHADTKEQLEAAQDEAAAYQKQLEHRLWAAEGLRRAALHVGMWGAPYHEALAEAVLRYEEASSPTSPPVPTVDSDGTAGGEDSSPASEPK